MPPDPKAFDLQKRLKKLLERLGLNALKIQEKYNDIGTLPPAGGRRPSLMRKFTKWVEQIAGLQEKEQKILSDITTVEERHRLMRKARKLKPAKAPKAALLEPEPKPKRSFWSWLLLFWLMDALSRKKPEGPKNG